MGKPCPSCGCFCEDAAVNCVICGTPLVAGAAPVAPAVKRLEEPESRKKDFDNVRLLGTSKKVPVGWVHLGIGVFVALLFTLTPTLRFMGWLVGSLFHETGHVVFGWYVGCPAYPAISLRGHAAAVHQGQTMGVIVLIGLALVTANVLAWRTSRLKVFAGVLLGIWPFLTFIEPLRELGFLLSGHLGELTFAGIFLVRARTGVAVQREAERPFYAGLAWFLVVRNAMLGFGIAFSASVRLWYLGSGSFGLRNDYVRVAYEVLGVSLESVGFVMGLVSLTVAPLVFRLTWQPKAEAATARATGGGWSPKPMSQDRVRV